MNCALDAEIATISALDAQEHADLSRFRALIASGVALWRGTEPDRPDPHLVSYFPVVDPTAQALLLGAHRKSGLWLPPGGHVEAGEHPRDTVRRECLEELRIQADFLCAAPVSLTITRTRGAYPHEDISLWYALSGIMGHLPDYDIREYTDMQWFEWTNLPLTQSDPQLKRFAAKVFSALPTGPETPLLEVP
jgi:8-oxo-dGTP diphosphatase